MGNCFVYKSSATTETAKLIDPRDGTLRQVKLPVRVAELMLQNPGHAISSVDQLKSSQRVIIPMRADDEMEAGKVYMLFPVNRINHKATEAETMLMEAVSGKRSIKKRSGSGAQVSPATAVDEEVAEEREDDEVIVALGRGMRWCPVLEPISEVL